MEQKLNAELLDKIRQVAPGTKLRKALERIIEAQLGALIVFVSEEELKVHPHVFQLGFRLDTPFSPEKLYELAKMDGAVVVDENVGRILAANVHLVPDPLIPTGETGTRHRTAERIAKQFRKMSIAISKRRNVVTLYYKEHKYVFEDLNFVLTKVSQTINALEKFRELFDRDLETLNFDEIDGSVTLDSVCGILIRGAEIRNISRDLETSIVELGSEGKLSSLRLREILRGLEETLSLLVMDYHKREITIDEAEGMLSEMWELEYKPVAFAKFLGYEVGLPHRLSEITVNPRGYRFLRTTIHIPMNISQNVIKSFHNLSNLARSNVSNLQEIEGIGSKRARAILRTLRSVRRRKG